MSLKTDDTRQDTIQDTQMNKIIEWYNNYPDASPYEYLEEVMKILGAECPKKKHAAVSV